MRLLSFFASLAIFAACERAPGVAARDHASTAMAEPQRPVDSTTAVRIAETAWRKAFGDMIDSERPFTARLKDSVWEVATSYPPPGWLGGGAYAIISRRDGRIIKVYHEQ